MDNNAVSSKIKSDIKTLGISFVALFIILKLVFFNESITNTLLSTVGLYWILILPAFGLTYLIEDIEFLERLVISIPLSASIVGISSYYLGILGVPAVRSAYYVPALFVLLSAAVAYFKLKGFKE
ncbi:Uncharacterised protein [uncultured archaeon]|nr:Uncharacterised protein [uncultured archaeon]